MPSRPQKEPSCCTLDKRPSLVSQVCVFFCFHGPPNPSWPGSCCVGSDVRMQSPDQKEGVGAHPSGPTPTPCGHVLASQAETHNAALCSCWLRTCCVSGAALASWRCQPWRPEMPGREDTPSSSLQGLGPGTLQETPGLAWLLRMTPGTLGAVSGEEATCDSTWPSVPQTRRVCLTRPLGRTDSACLGGPNRAPLVSDKIRKREQPCFYKAKCIQFLI